MFENFLNPLDVLPECNPRVVPISSLGSIDDWVVLLEENILTRAVILSAIFVLGSPLGWNVLGRLEYYSRVFTWVFRSKFVGCYITSAYIFTFSLFRNMYYEKALGACATVDVSGHPTLHLIQVVSGYILFAVGAVFVITSSWALGIIGTYNGDYFGILMEERITQFPFSVLDNPMYVGSTLLFLSRAIQTGSPAGLVITAWVWIVYKAGCYFEEPFTSMIYEEATIAKEAIDRKAASAHPEQFTVEHCDIEEWSIEDVSYWLKHSIAVDSYIVDSFKSNAIDGSVLGRLDLIMLRDDLKVKSLGDRFRIIDAAREYREAHLHRLEKRKGNKWISERKRIERKIRESIADIGFVSAVTKMARRVTSRSPTGKAVKKSKKKSA